MARTNLASLSFTKFVDALVVVIVVLIVISVFLGGYSYLQMRVNG